MAIETTNEVIEFPLNKRGDVLCVRTVNANGKAMIDVRKFYTNDADELAPTSKGIMLTSEVWAEILRALQNEVITLTLESGRSVKPTPTKKAAAKPVATPAKAVRKLTR